MANTTVSTQKPGHSKKKKEKMPARSKVLQRRETFVSYMFLLPALIFFVGFVIFPMASGVITSFTNASFQDPKGTAVGFANYIRLFQDKIFLKSAVTYSPPVTQYHRPSSAVFSICRLLPVP